MRVRWAARFVGAALVALCLTLLLLEVRTQGPRGATVTCGSSWDVISGRVGWPQWWSWDTQAGSADLARTSRCPGAVNGRMWLVTGLFLAALATMATAEVLARKGRPAVRTSPRAMHTVGIVLLVLGAALTVAGVIGIALLTADPTDPLFLYVSRPVAVLVGLLLLVPAVLIAALGLVAMTWSQPAAGVGSTDART
jgi:hypothetical protein